ncbi:MAG: UbiH/UbiF/VisC/COQ6 family ubiquinone biosynthesis hydroxylase [Sphingomonadales bacterium]
MAETGSKQVQSHDIAIVGGGLVGLTLGIALARHGFEVLVVDIAPPETTLAKEFDGRSSAIAFAGYKLFKAIGLWPHLKDVAQPINEIRVSDGPSRLFVHFDHKELGDEPLGFMLENRHIRLALHKEAAEVEGLTLKAPCKASDIERDKAFAHLSLDDGTRHRARLLIAADGRGSRIREDAGIGKAAWSYNQSGIVATVHHERSHDGIAHERFLPSGPFAILPLTGNRASIVWTATKQETPAIMGLSDRAFESEMARRFGNFLGPIHVEGPRWSYPLNFQHAHRYVLPRLALVGDAAHGIHPIAGQGLNLGLKDIAALVEVLVDAARIGRDIGDVDVLERYARWRRSDVILMSAATDVLNRLFSNDIAPIRVARDLGLGIVNKLPFARKMFMENARGSMGKLPKLLRGDLV